MIDPVKERSRLIGALAVSVTAFYCSATLFTALAPVTLVELTGNAALGGVPGAIFLVLSALAAPLAGMGMNRFGRLPVLKASLLLGVAGSLVSYAGHVYGSTLVFSIGLALLGCVGGVVLLSRLMASDLYEPERQGRVMGLVMSGAVLGGIIGPGMTMGVARIDGWRPTYTWLVAVFFFLSAFIWSRRARVDSVAVARKLFPGNPKGAGGMGAAAAPRAVNIGLLTAGSAFCHALMVALMSVSGMVMHHHHLEMESIYVAMGIHFISMFGFMPLSGMAYRRLGIRASSLLSAATYLAAFALFPWVEAGPGFTMVLILLGAAWSLGFLAYSTELGSATTLRNRASVLSRNDFLASLGGAALSVLAGKVFADWGRLVVSEILGAIAVAMPIITVLATKTASAAKVPVPDTAPLEVKP